MLKLSFDWKGYGVKKNYVLRSRFDLLNLAINKLELFQLN